MASCPDQSDILLVDNASTDGTLEWARTKKLTLVPMLERVSLATCWNTGIQLLWRAGREDVLILNNDVEMLYPSSYMYLSQSPSELIGIASGVSVDTRKTEEVFSFDSRNSSPNPDFSCFLLRKWVTDQIGYFDEGFFPAYWEDCSYHIRMHRAGIKAMSYPIPFYHERSQTLKNADPAEQALINRGFIAGKKRFLERYGCLPGTPEYGELFK